MYWQQVFEGLMLVCFGFSWPISILKMVRVRRAEGKSALFVLLVLFGYLAGIGAKLVKAANEHSWPETVILLYLLNLVFVSIDLALVLKYRVRPARLHL
jgi:hypothetical protein